MRKLETSTPSPCVSVPLPGRKPFPPLPVTSSHSYMLESGPVSVSQGLATLTPNSIPNSTPTYHTTVENPPISYSAPLAVPDPYKRLGLQSLAGSAQFATNVDFKVDAAGSMMFPTHSPSPAMNYIPPSAPIYRTSVPSSMPAPAASFQLFPSSSGFPASSASIPFSGQQAVGKPSIYPTQQQAVSPHVQASFHPSQEQAHPSCSQSHAPQQQQPQQGGSDLAKAGLHIAGRVGLWLAKEVIRSELQSELQSDNNGNADATQNNWT